MQKKMAFRIAENVVKYPFRLLRCKLCNQPKGRRFRCLPQVSPAVAKVVDNGTGAEIEFVCRGPKDVATVREVFSESAYTLEGIACGDPVYEFYKANKNDNLLVLDCGANMGASAVLFSVLYSQCRIVAIEPDPDNVALHRKNCDKTNVELIQAAVSNSEDTLYLQVSDNPRAHTVTDVPATGDAVQSVSVDWILKEYSTYKPFILKIDVEGFERELFADNPDWIDRFPVIVIELHDWLSPLSPTSAPFLNAVARRNRLFLVAGENVISIDRRLYGVNGLQA